MSLMLFCVAATAQENTLNSPDGSINLTVNFDEELTWEVSVNGKQVIMPSKIGMELTGDNFPEEKDRIKKVKREEVSDIVRPVVPHKNSAIAERYNEMSIRFKSDFTLVFRAYNDGVAYRFVTDFKGNVIVLGEQSEINFPPNTAGMLPIEDSFMSHNERSYIKTGLDTINNNNLMSLPALFSSNGYNVLVTETALENYPGMWLRGEGPFSLKASFPYYPGEEKLEGDRNLKVLSRRDFLAETAGERAYPWRVFLISGTDAGLIESNLTYLLSGECRLDDTEWIKPGKVAWDWWNNWNIYGVDFKAGVNNKTYEYYIDFAAENGIEYVILDEGWYRLGDVLDVVPEIDIEHLCSYAESKGVGIILWVVWNTFEAKLDRALAQFEEWGVKGIKVDFMQRDDQVLVDYYWRVAEKAANHKMLVDFHGSYKPAGLRRSYPNVITREGLKGLEHCKWSSDITPDHNLTIPFIRMVAGPMDYTPGAMVNHDSINFHPMYTRPASMGTRAHQMALYVAYESPLQMLADSPVNYRKEQECTDFITKVPVTWDETKVLEAKTGDYLVIARRSGDDWFVGAMTDWTARDFDLDLSFLDDADYEAVIFSDGINATRNSQDYKKSKQILKPGEKIRIQMAPGGGWVARLVKK